VMCLAWGEEGSNRLFSGGQDGTVRAWDVRMGARSLFLCDPYALSENRPPLKTVEMSEEELERRQNPFGPAVKPLNLREVRWDTGPYQSKMNPCAYLGSHKGREGHTGQTTESKPFSANPMAAPPSPPRWQRDKQQDNFGNVDHAERARHSFEPPMREYVYEASIAHRGAVISLAFLQEAGRRDRLLSCGVDGKLRIWDASTGAPAVQGSSTVLEVDSWSKPVPLQLSVMGSPEDVCFLPEGNRVSIRCLRTGELLCGLAAHTQEVNCAAAFPGRNLLFTGANDGRLLKWRLESNVPAHNVICLD